MLIGIGTGVPFTQNKGYAALVRNLFSNGEQGLWLDFWDTTKIFQDSAGTIPVTGAGDLYGMISDKSGRGNNATQGTTGAKPTAALNTAGKLVAVYDGFDDFMATSAINFTSTGAVTVFAAVRKLSDAAQGIVCELSADANTFAGSFNLQAPASATIEFRSGSRGTAAVVAASADNAAYAAPITTILTAELAIPTDTNILSVNGVQAASSSVDQGTGNYGNYALYVGMRGGTAAPLNAQLSSLIVVGRSCTAAEKAAVLAYQASNMGLVL